MTQLPPAQEKDLRGEVILSMLYWERERKGLEKKLTEAFGETWTCPVDPLAIYPYLQRLEGIESDYVGQAIERFIENVVEYFIQRAEKDPIVKKQISTICSAHSIQLEIDTENQTSKARCEISNDGILKILISESKLAEDPLEESLLCDETLQQAFNST